jgi:hypothetical protein
MELSVYRMHYMALIRAEWMRMMVDARWKTNFRPEKLAALMARFMVLRGADFASLMAGWHDTKRFTTQPKLEVHPGNAEIGVPSLWCFAWRPGEDTGPHDHGPDSYCSVYIAQGSIMEDGYPLDRLCHCSTRRLYEGSLFQTAVPYIHRMYQPESEGHGYARTVHAYWQPLVAMQYYAPNDEVLAPANIWRQ